MDSKLTLKLKGEVIEKAKDYAKVRRTSISKLVENYLQKITNEPESKNKITPLVKSLSGIIDISKNDDPKKGYADYLSGKYK